MPYILGIPAALAARGLAVETVPGWETRGSSSFGPAGVVDHWTAGPRGATGRPSLNVVIHGRSDLPGPLCQVYLDRNGIPVVVAAGRANHAGAGGIRGLVGNSSVFGIEAEAGGDGDWTAAQRQNYPIVNAALLDLMGRDASWVFGHNEWAPSRKIDIRDWDMPAMRAQVGAVLKGGSVPSTPNTPVVDSRPRNQDGSLTIAQDGIRGPATIARWQEVMGTFIDGAINRGKPSPLIAADQRFLNSVVDAGHIHNLTGKRALDADGYEGVKTIKVRQFWLWNLYAPAVFGRSARGSDFDGINGTNTNRLHQYALNRATARTGRY